MIILITFASHRNVENMIRNMDKRHAGDVPAAADGTAATVIGLCFAKPLFGPPKHRKQPERYAQCWLKFF
jgi:hypothetical protein